MNSINKIPFILMERIPLVGSRSTSIEYQKGELLFDQATQHYEKGNYNLAYQKFMQAAQIWLHSPDHFYESTVRENRLIAYKNATWSMIMAELPTECKQLLLNAIKQDPDCSKELNEIIIQYLSKTT